jgi:hypothetical protein
MAKTKIKTCESCLRSFRGRIDARTCSASCRQRLYRTSSIVAKETKLLEDKLKAAARRAEADLALAKVTEGGFLAGSLAAPSNPLHIRSSANGPRNLEPRSSQPEPLTSAEPPTIIKPAVESITPKPLTTSKVDIQKEFEAVGASGKTGKGLLKFMTAALVMIFILGGLLAVLDFTGLLPTHYSQQISVNKLGDTVQNITNQVNQLHNQVTTLKGEAGTQGEPGAAGQPGTQGEAGVRGDTGAQGPAGDAGCINASCVSRQATNQGVQEAGNINISGDTNIGGVYRINGNQISLNDLADNVNIARLNGTGPQTFTGNNKFTGTILSANVFNTTNAFQVQNAAASGVFTVDTVNDGIAINKPSASYAVDVVGDVSITGTYRVNGVAFSSGTLSDGSNLAKLNANQTFSGNNTFSSASNSFTGNGAGLTSLNASNLSSGTVNSARLPANLVKLDANQTFTGYNTFQNSVNSTTAFQIQNATGGALLTVDSIAGTVNATSLLQNGNPVCDASGNCAGVGGEIGGFGTTGTIPIFTNTFTIGDSLLTQAAGTVTAGGNFNVTTGSQYRINGVQISSSALSNDANLAKLSANQTFNGNNTFSSASNSFTGNGAGLTSLSASNITGGTLNDARLSSNVALLNGTGPQIFTGNNKFTGTVLSQNTTDSAAAFQVQNAAGNEVMTVDTSGGLVALGKASILSGDLLFYSSAGSGSITLQAANLGSTSFNIALPAANGTICLTTGNCAGVGGVGDILNNGNSFSAPVTLGTNDANSLIFETNNQNQATIAVGGATTFKNSADSAAAFQIQNAAGASLLNSSTSGAKISLYGTLAVTDVTPTNPAVVAGSNQGGTLSGAAATTYYYKITGLNAAGESIASSEVSINGASFTPLTVPTALTAADSGLAGNVSCNNTAGQGCRYQVTFVTANGETTAGTTSTPLLNVASKQISLSSIPVGPTGTTARKIYRSTNNSAFLLALTINDNSTVASTDNLAAPAGAIPGANTARTNLNNATISWTLNPGATSYRIYRGTTSGVENAYQTSAASPFTDTGAAGTAASPPSRSTVAQFSVGNASPVANFDVTGTTRIQAPTSTAAALQVLGASSTSILNLDTTSNSLTVNQGNFTVTGLANPAIPVLTSSASGGTLAAATYLYMLAATNVNGTTTAIASNPASVTTGGAASQNTLTWTAVPNAPGYNVYRSTNGGTNWFVNSVAAGTTSIVDNGTNFTWGSGATPPTTNTTGGNLTSGGSALFKNLSNSTTAFRIQDAAGSGVLNADTVNRWVGINNANPQATLDVLSSSPSFYDGFETGTLPPFTTSAANGGGNWTISTTSLHSGTYGVTNSLGLGCGTASGTLTLVKTVNSPGTISFWYTTSNLFFSSFIFRIDGVNQLNSTGAPWTLATFATTAGTHTFTWVASCNNGNGGTYSLDDVTLTNAGAGSAAIFNGGNVGIGTTFPNASLEVAGTSLFHPAAADTTSLLQIQNAAGGALFNSDTLNSIITVGQGNLLVTGLGVPAAPTLAAGSNQGGTLSGSAATTYYYKVTAINTAGNETLASPETSFNGASFTPLTAPGAPSLALTAGTNLGIGLYRYKVTFVTANGETTGGTTASITTTASNQAVNLTNIAVGPSGTTARKIYRTTVGAADGTQLLLTTINDNSTTIYSDTTADGGLGAALPGSNTARTNLNNISVSFAIIPGSTTYRIYRGTTAGSENAYQTTATSPFTDTGAAGTGASTPTSSSVERLGIGTATPTANLTVAGTGLFKNAVDTTAALQIQNAAGNSVLGVDTTGAQVLLGKASTLNGTLAFNNSTNSNTVSIQSGITTSSYTLTLPTALPGTSACLQSNNTGSLSFTSCITGSSATLAASYSNGSGPADSTISLDSTRQAVVVKDNSTPLGASLFTVQNNTGSSKYLDITSSGVNTTGITASSNINSSGGGIQTNSVTRIDNSGNFSATTVSSSGNINTTAGTLQTNSVTRLDNSGNLTSIGNFTAAAGSTFSTTGANGFVFKPGTDNISTFQLQNNAGTSILNADSVNARIGIDNSFTALGAPTQNNTSTSTTGGTLAAATYFYKITTIDSTGGESVVSNEKSQTTTGSTSTVTLSWVPVTGASGYKIYRSTTTNNEVYLTTALGTVNGANLNYTDTGAISVGSATPPTSGTAYTSTNNFNSLLQLSVGGNGTPTGQLYVSGTQPLQVGIVAAGTGANSVYVQGRYAYVTSFTSNLLQVFDISIPARPIVVGSAATGTGPYFISVQGHYAYVINNTANTLQVFDISNPAAPTALSTVATGSQPKNLYASGRYIYITNYASNNFQIFDVSNPASPSRVGVATTGTNPVSIFVQGRYAYVTNYNSDTLQIFDVSNPASPSSVGTVSASNGPYNVFVQGRYAYVLGASSPWSLYIYDVSNPASPVKIGTASTSTSPQSVFVQGRFAYLINTSSNNMQTFDVSNPTKPVNISTVSTGTNPSSVFVSGRYAYVANFGGNSLQIFDLGGEYSQQLEAGGAEFGTLEVNSNASFANDVTIQGGLQIGQSLQASGNIGATGSLYVQGSYSLAGGFLGGTTVNNLATPGTPTITTVGTTGATTWKYRIAAVSANGGITAASAEGSTTSANGNATLTGSNLQRLSWTAVNGAVSYKVYRTAVGTSPATTGLIATVSVTALDDTGLVGDGSSFPTTDSTGNFTVNGNGLVKSVTNSATAFQVQNSSGSQILGVDSQNSQVTVTNLIVSVSITVNGHITTGNSSGSTTVTAGAAANCTGSSPTVTIAGNDTSGTVTITTDSTGPCSAGILATVTFANAYGSVPRIVLTPAGVNASTLQYYNGTTGTASFTIDTNTVPAAATIYKYTYWTAQ